MRIVRRPPSKTQLAAQPPKCCSSPDGPPQSSFAGRTFSACATWGVALPSSCRKGRIRIGGRARRNYLPPPRQNCVATASGDAAGSTGPGTQILRSRGQTWMDGSEAAARQPVRHVVALVGLDWRRSRRSRRRPARRSRGTAANPAGEDPWREPRPSRASPAMCPVHGKPTTAAVSHRLAVSCRAHVARRRAEEHDRPAVAASTVRYCSRPTSRSPGCSEGEGETRPISAQTQSERRKPSFRRATSGPRPGVESIGGLRSPGAGVVPFPARVSGACAEMEVDLFSPYYGLSGGI